MSDIADALTRIFNRHRIVFWYDVKQELREYEDDVLYPLATQRVEIDLDDGVKVNYNKFGDALKRVPGLSG